MRKPLFLFTLFVLPLFVFAQKDKWDLQRCVDYAEQHNISVRQSDVQARLTALQTELARGAVIPTLGLNTSAGYQFGRTINPATNQFINQQFFFSKLWSSNRRYFIQLV